jgi:hypothetical protein
VKPTREVKLVKVFDTKYVLTQGILELEVEECEDKNGIYYWSSAGTGRILFRTDAFKIREEAVVRATELRDRKIKNLKKQLDALERLIF